MGIFHFVWLRSIFYMVTCGNPMPTSQGFVTLLAGALCTVKILRVCELLSECMGTTGVRGQVQTASQSCFMLPAMFYAQRARARPSKF